MPDQSARPGSTAAPATRPYNSAVEAILLYSHPMITLAEAAAAIAKMNGRPADAHTKKVIEEVEAQRTKLLALPELELRKLHQQVLEKQKAQQIARAAAAKAKKAAKEAAKEAAKFYNRPSANADFAFWTKVEYWKFDEALALLLAKDPKVLTWAAMKRELEPETSFFFAQSEPAVLPEFVHRYQQLRILAERSSAMKPAQLKPADVIAWAHDIQAVDIPPALQSLLPTANAETSRQVDLLSPANEEIPMPLEVHSEPSEGTSKKWTTEKLQVLSAYRDQHGTRAAAKQFGISDARVRQLLPMMNSSTKKSQKLGVWTGLKK
ncbi:hypothetical protein AEP_01541 [Curvibacter sp. AEP1-3]|uniref:helix-turn-helix domain-containing protein n=1 Tax=Curvibacter sp. AEP1-3 TaxID=1844971 RepID=UPI000B5673B8|nr:helix-turn-helix domain-containing protein [Curvibacter sp. AEP1-3]ARV18487.1 hypothetical protein AEP_01541 [Curvibacter sp. AEP1-3]